MIKKINNLAKGLYENASRSAFPIAAFLLTTTLLFVSCENDSDSVPITGDFRVAFVSLGGSYTPVQGVNYGSRAKKPSDPVREGYTFSGWYKSLAYTDPWNFDSDEVTANAVIYPKWTRTSPETFAEADRPQMIYFDEGNPYYDWFLPSIDELAEIRTVLGSTAADRTQYKFADKNYWSSTEDSAGNAFGITFTDGTQVTLAKNTQLYVRAARIFTSGTAYQLKSTGPADGWIFHITDNGNGTFTCLECAPSDQSTSMVWSNVTGTAVNGTSAAVGTGQSNSTKIMAQSGHTGSAARTCENAITRRKDQYPFYYAIKLPWNYDKPYNSARKYPMYISLHTGGGPISCPTPPTDYPCLVLSPKLDDASSSKWAPEALTWFMKIIEKVEKDYRVDTNRIFISGFSQGGAGTYQVANALYEYNGQLLASIDRAAGSSSHYPEMYNLPDEAYGRTSVNLRVGLNDYSGTVDAIRKAYDLFKNSPYNEDAVEVSFTREISGNTGNVRLIIKDGVERARITEFPNVGHNDFYDASRYPWFYNQCISE